MWEKRGAKAILGGKGIRGGKENRMGEGRLRPLGEEGEYRGGMKFGDQGR